MRAELRSLATIESHERPVEKAAKAGTLKTEQDGDGLHLIGRKCPADPTRRVGSREFIDTVLSVH
jgi:hypothetical protein